MQRNQKGFTLIELVIVIVILGILSAFALPRFADLGGDARAASIEGAAGAMRSASSIVRSACLASSDCDTNADAGDADSDITLEGQNINLAFGYPVADDEAANPDGILAAAQIDENDYDITTVDANVTLAGEGAPNDGDNCQIQYTQAADADTPPVFALDVSDC